MITIQQVTEVPYPPAAMFALINDVKSYPKFVPFCTQGIISKQNNTSMEAALTFSFLNMSYSFKTYNRLNKPQCIEMQLLHGPLNHLKGSWQFKRTPQDGTKVTLFLKFELAYPWLHRALYPVLQAVEYQSIKAFVRRAEMCYSNTSAFLAIEVAYADDKQQKIIPIRVLPGYSVGESIQASGILEEIPHLKLEDVKVGIYGRTTDLQRRPITLETLVKAKDRIEIYTPLKIDPKQRRRLQAKETC